MEHGGGYIWLGIAIILLVGMRIAKGDWVKALMAAFMAPLLLAPMFIAVLIAVTGLSKIIYQMFGSGKLPTQQISDFSLAGAIAVTSGLFITYCIWERQTIGMEVKGYLGASSGSANMTSPHALKRKFG